MPRRHTDDDDLLIAELGAAAQEFLETSTGRIFEGEDVPGRVLTALETLVLQGRLKYPGNPVLDLCVANAIAVTDPAGGTKLDKAKSTGRIDALQALAMAVGLAPTRRRRNLPSIAVAGCSLSTWRRLATAQAGEFQNYHENLPIR